MRWPRPTAVAAVGIAAALAALGVAVNLRLLEPHRGSDAPAVLGATIERTTGPTGPPPSSTPGVPSTTVAPPPTQPPPTTPTTTAWRRSYAVGAAGSVTIVVRGARLEVESVSPGAGWVYEVEGEAGDEVEIRFRRPGEDDESTFHAALHGDELRVEIEPAEGESPDD